VIRLALVAVSKTMMRQISRRCVLATLGSAWLLRPVARAQPVAASLNFTVLRDGAPIGTHRVEFKQEGDTLAVDISIDMVVKFALIPVYRYMHRSREIWRQGLLQSLEARTNDDGTRTEVRARRKSDGLAVEGSGGSFLAPTSIEPTSYWHEDMTLRSRLLDTQNGVIVDVTARKTGIRRATIAGREIDVRSYELSGDLTSRLGYSAAGEWVDLAFLARGSRIVYQRDAPPAAATTPSGAVRHAS